MVQTDHNVIVTPPATSDYLPSAIRKKVLETGLKHPFTIYPIAIGFSCTFVGLLFGAPLFYLGALAGILGGAGYGASQIFLFNEKIGAEYIKELNQLQKQYEQSLKQLLNKGLRECQNNKDIETFAIKGQEQFRSIDEKLASIRELLEIKLNTGEMTYGRFLGAAEQVSLSVLDNLKEAVSTMKSMSTIRTGHIKERLQALNPTGNSSTLSPHDQKESQALTKRLQLWQDQSDKISGLLLRNEEAMTEMEQISASVASWNTDGRFADSDFESAIKRLQELASHAHEYNR